MILALVVSSFLLAAALGQEFTSQCPTPNGYFSDSVQCDKYYECADDVLTEKLCPDGMGFNELNPMVEKCDFLLQIDCTERPDLQPAQATEVCPRQNGYFPMADETNCNEFHYCAAGVGNLIVCPESLVFSLKTVTCVWPEEAGRVNCQAERLLNFSCSEQVKDKAIAHPRYADPHDCQYFYVCINGKEARRNGCAFGQVYDSLTTACSSPIDVPECADHYTKHFENDSTLGADSGRISGDIIAAAIESGFDVPQLSNRQRIHNPSSMRRGTTTPAPALDANDSPVLTSTGSSVDQSPEPAPKPGTRQSTSHPRAGGRRHKRPSTTTTTTTTTPPAPPPLDDYVYYVDALYYNNYTTDDAALAAAPAAAAAPPPPPPITPAPTEAPSRFRSSFRPT